MDEVKWIRLKVGMFDGTSFKKIKRAKIDGVSYRDKLTAVWSELLDLAGKSNANGYLIDNNEMPYHSFEDIATMLDREEKEIELCMNFFINEKMVEIIDDIYCLTNFMMYQNQEGLEKIREQKRIAQAKWRERKKQGLVGNIVESTNASTDNLLSNSISDSISNSISISENTNIIKEEKSEIDEMFDMFWIVYPKKSNKKGAKVSFKRIKNLKTEFPLIMEALERFKKSKQWTKQNGEFIPLPTSWINQERWKDEHIETREDKLKRLDMSDWL